MRNYILGLSLLFCVACDNNKYLFGTTVLDDTELKIAVRIYGEPAISPKNQKKLAAATKEIVQKIRNKKLEINKDTKYLRLNLVHYDTLEKAKAGSKSDAHFLSLVSFDVAQLIAVAESAQSFDYLDQASSILFYKGQNTDTSAREYCGLEKGQNIAPNYCKHVFNPQPNNLYDLKDGKYYIYNGAVSEEDAKKGIKAGTSFAFEYLGIKDNEHRIRPENAADIYSCTSPCESIKHWWQGKVVERTNFEEGTVIGSVFIDAMNGELEVYKPPVAKK